MSDNGFLRNDRLKSVLSRIKSRVGSDIASAISESTSTLSSVITSGDLSSLNEAKGYADGLKIIIDSNITNGDSSTLSSAKSYTDEKISSVNSAINDLIESIPGQINLALETYENSIDYADAIDLTNHTSNTSNPHSVTYTQTGAAAASHTHTESDITDLGSYASSSHTHVESDITDLGDYASSSHTHTESDITDLGSYASSSHTHTVSDLTDASTELASKSHTHIESDITDLQNYSLSNHTHVEADITDLGNYSVTGHSHTVSDITDASTELASKSHTHTEADITDLGSYAAINHTHSLSNITDVSATAMEVNTLNGITATTQELNNTTNSTRNIQMQLNDARMYGFFPEWEYEHEYDVGDCVKTGFCKPTEYFECIVKGISGTVISNNNDTGIKLSEDGSLYNGKTFIDGSCVWLSQDLRDTRPIGAVQPMIWRPMTTYNNLYYGIGLVNSTNLFIVNSDNNVAYIRFIKYCIGSAIFTMGIASDHRLCDLTCSANISGSSDTLLCHLGGALVVLDWCFNPFNYLDNNHYSVIDDRAWAYIENILSTYNSTYECSLTKNQIISNALIVKDKIKNNNLPSESIFTFKTRGMGGFPYLKQGNYGVFTDAGLPNITGNVSSIRGYQGSSVANSGSSSALYWNTIQTSTSNWASTQHNITSGNKAGADVRFSASRTNSIYGNSTTVTPKSIGVYYLVKF